MELKSQEMRKLAPELDPLRIGTGWRKEDLEKPQVMIESTFGDSHPGSGHLNILVDEVRKGVVEAALKSALNRPQPGLHLPATVFCSVISYTKHITHKVFLTPYSNAFSISLITIFRAFILA